METKQMRCMAEIDLGALKSNMRLIRSKTNKNAKVMAVVKADAYGHGAVESAKAFLESGAEAFGVATVAEGVQLRHEGISVPILVLGAIMPQEMHDAVAFDITVAAFDYENTCLLSEVAVKSGKKAKVHIKIDTGMHRIGIDVSKNGFVEKVMKISALPGIEIDGIFSHLACADEKSDEYTKMQIERFNKAVEALENSGLRFNVKHLANSAAIFRFPQAHFDMVRAGIVSYGLAPSPYVEIEGLTPAMSLRAAVSRVESIKPGDCVSYGATYMAEKSVDIATMCIGYADGYSRMLTGKSQVIIGGKRAKIVGRICMDQCIAEIPSGNNIKAGDVATLFGKDGKASIAVEEIADLLGTINYEVICMVSRRVPRVYVENGKVISVLNYII